MNNVWTAIAFRAPCATRQAQRAPWLHLFNGYARFQTSRCASSSARKLLVPPMQRDTMIQSIWNRRECKSVAGFPKDLSTTTILNARSRPSKKIEDPKLPSDSRLEPAPTAASHTEGLLAETETLTWRDYDPAGGMPIPGGERSQAQINGIFHTDDLSTDTGNYVLNVMHWRRMSGALIDAGIEFPKDSGVPRDQAIKGLEYVRSLDPAFDEKAAAQVWAEEESHRLQEELRERAVKLRLYKPEEELPMEEEQIEPEEEQGTEHGRERNRESQLQRIREENEAKYEAEQAQRADAEAKAEMSAMHSHRGPLELAGGVQPSVELVTYTGPDGITISRPQTKAWLQPVERKPWVKYYEEQAQIIKENSIPQLSILRRLGPSFLMLLFVLSAAVYISENYTPPPKSARLWPDTPPAVATLTTLTGTIAAFFVLSRMPPFWRTLSKYFTLVPVYPYAISLVGCAFRHQPLSHLLLNTLSLWLFGLVLHDDVGRGTFLSIFFASGALGAYTSLTYHVLRQNWTAYIFGSSGCVLGVVAAACTLRPNSTIKVFGQDVPIAVWLWLALWSATEVVAMLRFKGLNIDHAGHVGGLAAGFAAGLFLRRNAKRVNVGDSIEGKEKDVTVTSTDVT